MTAAATGTSAGGIISTASMYSAVGVEDSLGMARNMAAQQAAYTGQMAMGTPNMGAMTGYAMLGMDPMAPMRNGPEAMQNMVIDHLRGMSPGQRGGHRTRGALMSTGMSLDEIGAVLAQANLSQQDREYSTQLQGWVQRAANSPEADVLTRRQQNISEINAYAQARAHNVEMTKSYLRASGRERPMMAQFQDQLTEQWQRAQIQFWLSMQPMLERLRSIFEDLIKPGGGLATFGDIVSYMADMFARSLTLAVGAVMMFAGTLGVSGNIVGTGGNVLSELSQGEFRGAWGAVQAGQSRHRVATGMISGGQELILQALTESGYNPNEIDRLMGMNGRPGAPYEQSQVIVQGVPVDELISRGYRRGEQTGRVLPGQGSSDSIYNIAQP